MKDQCIEMNIKQKVRVTIQQMRIYIYFLELHFVGVYSLIVLVYSNRNNDAKKYNDKKYYLPKFIIKNYNAIINGKNCYDQPIDSDIK